MAFETWNYVMEQMRDVKPKNVKLYVSSGSFMEVSFTCLRPAAITQGVSFDEKHRYGYLACPPKFLEARVSTQAENNNLLVVIRAKEPASREVLIELIPGLEIPMEIEVLKARLNTLKSRLVAANNVLLSARRRGIYNV